MNARRTSATTERVLAQLRHDPRTIGLLLVLPALLTALIAWMFSSTGVFQHAGPAMIALFPFIVMFLVTSITTLRERRSGTLERLLTLPLGKDELITGYTVAFGLVGAVQSAVTLACAVAVCGLEVDGSLGLLFLGAVVDALLGTALGLLASAFARTEFQVVQFMPAFVFPQALLGGIFIQRDHMPAALHTIGDWLPLSHAIDGLAAATHGTHSAGWIWAQLGIVLAWTVGAIALAALTLRRRTA